MNDRPLLPILAATALFAVMLPNAPAVPMTYQIGAGSTITGYSDDPGLLIKTSFDDPGLVIKTSLVAGLENIVFDLQDSQSKTFNFFKIWTDETDVNLWEDTAVQHIEATLDFDVPDEAFSLYGETFGVAGIWQSGRVKWDGPAKFTVGDRTFSITLSNEEFNKGFFGLNEGIKYGAYVEATVKQISSSRVSVPDHGSTAMLLGLAFLSFAFIRRRSVTS